MKKRYQHNWRKEIGVTLKEVKTLCIKRNRRLPRVGRDMYVTDIYVTENGIGFYKQGVYIQNISGTFELYTYESSNDGYNRYYYLGELSKMDSPILIQYSENGKKRLNHGSL